MAATMVAVAPVQSEGPIPGQGGANISATNVPAKTFPTTSAITLPQSVLPSATSSPNPETSVHKKSFALTPHSEVSVTDADSSDYFASFNAGLSTIPGCFHTQTQLISNQYTTTAAIPCVAAAPQYSSQLVWHGSTNPNSKAGGGPQSEIPHSETSVTGSDTGSILAFSPNPVRGHGGNPLPEPETTVPAIPGGNVGSILGGPGQETTSPSVPQGVHTTSEPGPITAVPAAAPAPNPLPTTLLAPVPFGGSSPAKGQSVPSQPLTTILQPVPDIPKPSPVISIDSSTITADSSSQFVIGTQTLAPGGSAITHSGTVLSLPPSGSAIVIGPSTQAVQLVTPPPSITAGGQIVTENSASQFVIGGNTLKPGAAPIIANGQTISLAAGGSAVVINSQTANIAQPALPVITVGGAKITGNSASQYIINGQTLGAGGAPVTVAGQTLSIAAGGSAVVFGPSTQAFATPPMVLSTSPPLLTVGGSTITANAASNYVIAGQTLHAGGSAITVSGTIISLVPSASAVVIGGSTEELTPSSVLATTVAPLITLGSQVLHANAQSDYVIDGQTLTPGHAITVSGTVISLAPGASDVVIGGSTELLSPQTVSLSTGLPALTIGPTTITANADGRYILSGQTIVPGAHAVTIDGQLVSLAANDSFLVVGTSTESLHDMTMTGGTFSRSRAAAGLTAMATPVEGSSPTMDGSLPPDSSHISAGLKTGQPGFTIYIASFLALYGLMI
ncbi:MAG: hypothetical protein LQ352_005677 [Teloschistes flavicans]|nr:MAG: hypothetical protein LQ352_005677 [Teloschistes flavicans]